MDAAEQLCRICKHSKSLASFRHQRFLHRTTLSCIDCRTGSLRATGQTSTQPPSQQSLPQLPPSQDPDVTSNAALPATIRSPPPAPTPTVLPEPALNISVPVPTVAKPSQFVTRTYLSASIGELRQFLQDEIADAFRKVSITQAPPPPPGATHLPPSQPLPALPARIVRQDTLTVYDLPKLANLSWPGAPAPEDPAPVVIEGFSVVKGPSTSASNRQFVKTVPNFSTFGRLWVVYLSLRSSTSHDCNLSVSLGRFYQHVADLSEVFPWDRVAGYVIAVCTL
ncbi:uncharacterized protein UBRO_20156 [Ustilago bromivora]|uniref:Uncharacterized protein n=1 Tax=Ustilago bromivora TaxID=307758 RepID=A0A1K0GHM6_9BASI|nr:uncharacterized protein UBRO_20156 [Ustilago bromivora]